jgi:hypothetical protein
LTHKLITSSHLYPTHKPPQLEEICPKIGDWQSVSGGIFWVKNKIPVKVKSGTIFLPGMVTTGENQRRLSSLRMDRGV